VYIAMWAIAYTLLTSSFYVGATALMIKRHVNPEAFRGRGVVRIFMEEGMTLYRDWE
jgi:hypothetical protein